MLILGIMSAESLETYIVKHGDIGLKIAEGHGITFKELSELNPDTIWEELTPETFLKIPRSTFESPRGVYKVVKKLGSGTFGYVYLADYTTADASNSEQVALKKIALHEMNEEEKEKCKKEAELMERISKSSTSPHVIKYFDSFMIAGMESPSHDNLFIAMEYCSLGDLSSKIKANIRSGKEFDPEIVYDYIYQIADGINELHVKHKIAHRDLKPASILITWKNEKEVLKISDFGLAKVINSLDKSQSHSRPYGNSLYMSPEQQTLTPCRFPVVDIWAIGIIFYELCIAPKRLDENKMNDIRKQVKKDERVYLPSQYSAADTIWLNKMIAKDPSERMSADQVCKEAGDRTRILFYFYYPNNGNREGRICLFNSSTSSVEEIAKFHNYYEPYRVATTQNKIFGINGGNKSFEICDLNTRQISRGPDPPGWRQWASIAYFKDKLYYLGGYDTFKKEYTNHVNVLIDGQWQTGPAFPLPISCAQTIKCDEILYVIDGRNSRKIYRLSDDGQEWIEIGELPEERVSFGVASLNGKIYMTGGQNYSNVFKSCLCFDPSAPVDSRISRIADMNYARYNHSFIVANEKLYAIGGFQKDSRENFCNSIEEYDPQTDKWLEVGLLKKPCNSLKIDQSSQSNRRDKILLYLPYNNGKIIEGRICLFDSQNVSVDYIVKFTNLRPYEVTVITDKIFAISFKEKSFEIFDLNTRQISRGPVPSEWREYASVAYFKDKLYYLGGEDPEKEEDSESEKRTNRVDLLIDGKWQTGPAFPRSISHVQTITCDGILYVIDGYTSKKIYRLSDDGQEWIKIGELPEERVSFGVASLNGKIYITGGWSYPNALKSCLCFDPSAPVDSRISRTADMNYARKDHLLVVANGRLYAIGGFQKPLFKDFCDSIEKYDPSKNKWSVVGNLGWVFKPGCTVV